MRWRCSAAVLPRVATRSGGGGPPEGRWRGRAAHASSVRLNTRLRMPPPPCSAWSPSPASRGRVGKYCSPPPVGHTGQAAPNTPIVYTAIVTGSPFIASLSRPGGMVTGLSQIGPELGGKRLAILKEVLPQLRRVAVLGAVDGSNTIAETAVVTATAQQF